ncbi:MAG: universal stress protein [Blastocatellia bacterium]|nr:universal stress protein [Blastocatellia bacterium]
MAQETMKAMKILVAVDGSECGLAAVENTGRMPWPAETSVEVLAVAEIPTPTLPWSMPLPSGNFETWERIFEERATAQTAQALERFNEVNLGRCEVKARTLRGSAREAILGEADHIDADLIVLGTHGYNAFERFWLGSVSRAVAAHARCSVRIVRHKEARDSGKTRILLAVDGSVFGERAAAAIAARPWPENTEIKVISVIHLPFTPTPETWALPESYYSELERAGREQAREAIDRALALLAGAVSTAGTPLPISSEPIVGHAEDRIIETAKSWEADLIVVGSHGRSGWKRFLLGSVSHAVVSHAPCSVEIVRFPEDQTETHQS